MDDYEHDRIQIELQKILSQNLINSTWKGVDIVVPTMYTNEEDSLVPFSYPVSCPTSIQHVLGWVVGCGCVVFIVLIIPKGVIKVIVSSVRNWDEAAGGDQRAAIIPFECRLSGNYRSN